MTSCSTATLAAKSTLYIVHLQHPDFDKRFCSKVLRENGVFGPRYNYSAKTVVLNRWEFL